MLQGFPLQANPVEVLNAFEVQLNAHNVKAALALFTDDAAVYDPTAISCYGGTGYSCEPSLFISYTSKTQIRGWLQYLAEVDIEVKEVGAPQTTGNNVTWTWQVSNNGYRSLNIAPLVGAGEAIVQGNLIKYLNFRLSTDSIEKLEAALAASSRSPFSVARESIGFGLFVLGLVFPAAAAYYISRVRTLFAAVPKLKRPWVLLQAGVVCLFTAILVVGVRSSIGTSIPSLDIIQYVAVVLTGFFILVAMVLMKRVWLAAPDV